MTAGPGMRLSHWTLATGDEQERLVTGWNRTQVPLTQIFVHHMIASQAAQHSAKAAAELGVVPLSYGEPERKANQLPHHLRRLDIGPEVPVGVCMARTPSLRVPTWPFSRPAVPYLPCDTSYPDERPTYMLEDSGTHLVLTRQADTVLPAALAGCAILDLSGRASVDVPDSLPFARGCPRFAPILWLSQNQPA